MNTRAALEAILFVTESPVPIEELAEVLEVSKDQIQIELDALGAELSTRIAGWFFARPGAAGGSIPTPRHTRIWSGSHHRRHARRISGAALEVLAVIAYRQPVSRGQIAEIRGVDSDSAIRTLERMGLVEEAGRLPGPGNPAIYRTTSLFLEKLGVNRLQDLPPLADHVPPAEVVEALEETFRPG